MSAETTPAPRNPYHDSEVALDRRIFRIGCLCLTIILAVSSASLWFRVEPQLIPGARHFLEINWLTISHYRSWNAISLICTFRSPANVTAPSQFLPTIVEIIALLIGMWWKNWIGVASTLCAMAGLLSLLFFVIMLGDKKAVSEQTAILAPISEASAIVPELATRARLWEENQNEANYAEFRKEEVKIESKFSEFENSIHLPGEVELFGEVKGILGRKIPRVSEVRRLNDRVTAIGSLERAESEVWNSRAAFHAKFAYWTCEFSVASAILSSILVGIALQRRRAKQPGEGLGSSQGGRL